MPGSCPTRLDGDILPLYFEFISSNNTKALKDIIQVDFDWRGQVKKKKIASF